MSRWISVWCRAFSANFGELIWGDKLTTAADNDPLNAADIDISPTDDEGPTAAENEIDDDSENKENIQNIHISFYKFVRLFLKICKDHQRIRKIFKICIPLFYNF